MPAGPASHNGGVPSDLDAVAKEGQVAVDGAETLDGLRAVAAEFVGKKGRIGGLNRLLGNPGLTVDDRRAAGAAIQAVRDELIARIDEKRLDLAAAERKARLESERLDLTEVTLDRPRGHLHLVNQARNALEDVFIGMGYVVAEGPEAETDWYSFEALNFPLGHPARDGFDTLYLNLGDPGTVLVRPHTSPVQIRVMQSQPPPIYAVMPGRTYRKDTPDARHNPNFQQIEGLVVDRGITFGDLAGTIDAFTRAYFGADISSRLRPASFPFTEPSAEFEVTCVICHGMGCRTCSGTGWIELGGCGMVHPNVLRAGGVDPEEHSGFAFGFGIDRLAQMHHNIADMRILNDNDIRFASQF